MCELRFLMDLNTRILHVIEIIHYFFTYNTIFELIETLFSMELSSVISNYPHVIRNVAIS